MKGRVRRRKKKKRKRKKKKQRKQSLCFFFARIERDEKKEGENTCKEENNLS